MSFIVLEDGVVDWVNKMQDFPTGVRHVIPAWDMKVVI